MGGGNGQKSKIARERNMEKNKAAKGSQLESNKKAMTIQPKGLRSATIGFLNIEFFDSFRSPILITVQGMHANLYVYDIRSQMQRTCRSKASKV